MKTCTCIGIKRKEKKEGRGRGQFAGKRAGSRNDHVGGVNSSSCESQTHLDAHGGRKRFETRELREKHVFGLYTILPAPVLCGV